MTDRGRRRFAVPSRLNTALLALASAASAALLYGASHAPSGWLVLTCALAFSFTANTLFSLLHEAVHGVFAERRRVNDWAGRIAAAWFPTGLAVQRAFHLTHHRNNRSAVEQFDVLHDGDLVWLKRAQWYAILTGLYWAIAVAGVLAFLVVPRPLRARLLRRSGERVAEQTSAESYVGALDVLDALHPLGARLEVAASVLFQLALFWLLDLSLAGWAACYAAFAFNWSTLQYTDHAFSPLDARRGAWNLQVPALVRGLFLNYHCHLAHHQQPSVPWIHLPSLAVPGPRFLDVWAEAWRGPRAVERFPRFAVAASGGRRGLRAASPTIGDERGDGNGSRGEAGNASVVAAMSLAFALAFVVLYGSASVLSGFVPWRVDVSFAFERRIPFVPAWSAVYLSLIPLLLLLPLVLRRWRWLWPVAATLAAETLVASVFFVALPVESIFPAREASGVAGAFFGVADTLNLERNLFPSLHVAFAVTAVLALRHRCGGLGRALLYAWATAIAASTLLIHEHQLVDVLAGVLLAALAWRFVGSWAARPDVVAAVDIEILCARNAWAFARRHRRYGLIAFLLVVDGLPRWRERRVLRTGFCCLQAIDDLLDGDRACDGEPLRHVDALVRAMRSGGGSLIRAGLNDGDGSDGDGDGNGAGAGNSTSHGSDDDLTRLALAFVADLRAAAGDGAVVKALALIDVMRSDRRRVVDAAHWSRERLREQHRATFGLSLDLLLAARGSPLRAADVPELVDALGWCSTWRDLREDLGAGLVNVPLDVLREAGQDEPGRIDAGRLLASDAMARWSLAERDEARRLLDATDRRLAGLRGKPGRAVLVGFAGSIRGFFDRRLRRLSPRAASTEARPA